MFERLVVHPPSLLRRLYPEALWKVPVLPGDKAVYLTFDDGPNDVTTPYILDTMEKYNAKATFFVVGENVQRHPDIMRQIIEKGHALGNHTMHHLQGRSTPDDEYLADITALDKLLGTPLFRPPHASLRRSQYEALRHNFKIVMFDIVTMDYDFSTTVPVMISNIKRYTRSGSIIVFHDSLKARDRLEEALPQTLLWLKSEGYECRPLSMD